MRLGFIPAAPARLAAAPSLAGHRLGTMLPAPRLDRSAVPFQPRQFWNGSISGPAQVPEIPDCTAAAVANHALAVGALNGFDPIIQGERVPQLYAMGIGLLGTTPLPVLVRTPGAVFLDLLVMTARDGFETGADLLVPHMGVLAPVRDRIAVATEMLGGALLGITLYDLDMTTAASGEPWTMAPAGAPVGGHALMAWSYTGLTDSDTVRLATWGGFIDATWAWLEARVVEAYGLTWPQLRQTSGATLGVDEFALDAALRGMTA